MLRELKNDHIRIGRHARSDAPQAARKVIARMTTFAPSQGVFGMTARTEDGAKPTLFLTPHGAVEMVKALLIFLGGHAAICMATDDELRRVLTTAQADIKRCDDDSAAVVKAVTERHAPAQPEA